jgi:hypothetical protein
MASDCRSVRVRLAVVQLESVPGPSGAALADDEIRDLPNQTWGGRPTAAFLRAGRRRSGTRRRTPGEEMEAREGSLEPMEEFGLVRGQQRFAAEPGKPRLPASEE